MNDPPMTKRDFARHLRKNMSDAEARMWLLSRNRRLNEFKFRRQMPIGSYVADFVCLDRRLIIELDGDHHALHREYDDQRTGWLQKQGFRVLRFDNRQVLAETEDILEFIANALLEAPPHPLPQGERGPESLTPNP
jgi:adenine-specific DNA-methyltransferase